MNDIQQQSQAAGEINDTDGFETHLIKRIAEMKIGREQVVHRIGQLHEDKQGIQYLSCDSQASCLFDMISFGEELLGLYRKEKQCA